MTGAIEMPTYMPVEYQDRMMAVRSGCSDARRSWSATTEAKPDAPQTAKTNAVATSESRETSIRRNAEISMTSANRIVCMLPHVSTIHPPS